MPVFTRWHSTAGIPSLIVNQICKNLRLDFRSESSNKREISILAVLPCEKPFERDVFRFNPFRTFVRVNWNAILVSRHSMASI